MLSTALTISFLLAGQGYRVVWQQLDLIKCQEVGVQPSWHLAVSLQRSGSWRGGKPEQEGAEVGERSCFMVLYVSPWHGSIKGQKMGC